MQIKCGIDIVKDERLRLNLDDEGFRNRIFLPTEQVYADLKKYATIFTLKESVFKALEIQPPQWLEAEVSYQHNGKPKIILSDTLKPENLLSLDASASHEAGFTIGQVVIVLK